MGSRLLQAFVFVGAFLLFTVEPLCGRLLLPHYGGSFHVWATCLTFFQGTLFLGYVYCHLLAPRLGRWHLLVLLVPVAALPLELRGEADLRAPLLSVASTMTRTVGLPFLALSTTAVVAQSWLARSRLADRAEPYRLYAASNLGSLVGLMAYPLLIDPSLSLPRQRAIWTGGYVAYVALAILAARACRPAAAPEPTSTSTSNDDDAPEPIGPGRRAYWLLLSAGPSAFLLAVTNVLTLDVGSVPLLWTLPLAVYLATFVLVFREPSWCPTALRRTWFHVALCGVALYLSGNIGHAPHLKVAAIAAHLGVLFVVCLVAHHELHRARPRAHRLTGFYLLVSLGGWLGGLFVSLVAPRVFDSLSEYPVAVAVVALTIAAGRRRDLLTWAREERRGVVWGSALLVVLAGGLFASSAPPPRLYLHRNFYGTYAIEDHPGPVGTVRFLRHGTTIHGLDVLDTPPVARCYYGHRSPLADVLACLPRPRRAAILGLGAGVMLPHFGPGEDVTVYEIDPDNEAIARRWFRYLDGCTADARVVVGDARLGLGAAPDASLDVVIGDAFSSDCVPVHLLTREALEVYLRKLRPGGAVALHVSNRFLDLRPSLWATAGLIPGVRAAHRVQPDFGDLARGEYEFPSTWFVVTRDEALLGALRARGWTVDGGALPAASAWSDDRTNVLEPVWFKLTGG